MENTEEDTLLVEGSGEPEYNTYQLVWIQPDGTGVRQTVFEKSYAGAPSVYASHRAGNKILQDGSTGPSHSYQDASSVDKVQESYPGDDENTTQRHHLTRQHSETCTSCGALYRDISVSIDSESDVSDSESTHGRSMIVRQFSTDSKTDAMTAVEPSPLNRRNFSSYSREQFHGGNVFSKSASEQWTLEHEPHIANTKETQRQGSGALTNIQDIHPGPIPVQQSDKEAWTRTVVTKGPSEVTLSKDQETDSRVRSENVCIPHGASVVKEATAVDNDGLPGQTRVSEYRRIDGPGQVTVTRRGQGFPRRDQLHGKYGVRGPLVRHPSLEKKVPSNVFRTGSLHVADEPDGSRVCLVDNVIRDGGDGNMTPNRIETKLVKLTHGTQGRYQDGTLPGIDGQIQEEKLLAFSPDRKTQTTFSANGPKANVGKPVLEFHSTRLTTPYTDHTTPYQHRQVHGSDDVTLADDGISYGADLERDKKPSRPSDIAFTERTTTCDAGGFHKQIHRPGGETLTAGQRYTVPMAAPVKQEDGPNKPALSYDGPTDYVITKTSYKVPLDGEAALTGIRPSYEAVSSYRELPGEVSEATLKDTRSPHEAVSVYRELPGEFSEATLKDTRSPHEAVSVYRELPGVVSEATLKDTRSPHEAVSVYRELPGVVSEATLKDTRSPHEAVSGYRELPAEVTEATRKNFRPPHEAVSGYRELPAAVTEATCKDIRSPHEAVDGYRELPGGVSEARPKDFRPTHDAVSRYKELPGEVSEATRKDIRSPHEAVDGYRELPGVVSEARPKDFRPTHDAVSRYKELPGEVSEATRKDIRSPHEAVDGYRELPGGVSEARLKDFRPTHDAVSRYKELPGEVSEATRKDIRSPHEAVDGYRELPGVVSEARPKDFRPTHDAVSRYKELPGEVSEATRKDIRSPHEAVDGYRELPGGVSEARLKDFRPTHDAVSRYKELPGEVSEATRKDIRSPHEAVDGYRELPGVVSEARPKDFRPTHDAVSRYKELPGEVSEATRKDIRSPHEAVDGYRELPGGVSEARPKDFRPTHDAVSRYKELPGEVSEATRKDIRSPHDAVTGYRELPGGRDITIKQIDEEGQLGRVTLSDGKEVVQPSYQEYNDNGVVYEDVRYRYIHSPAQETLSPVEHQQVPERLSTQVIKQITRPTDQALLFKIPSVDLPSGHSYIPGRNVVKMNNQDQRTDIVVEGTDRLMHEPIDAAFGTERTHDAENQVHEESVVTSRNVDRSEPVQERYDHPDHAVTDNILAQDARNEYTYVQGPRRIILDPGNQEQPERPAMNGHKYIHEPNLVPRGNQHRQKPIVELTVGKKIDDAKMPGVDDDRSLDVENKQNTIDKVNIVTTSRNVVPSKPVQGPDDQPVTVDGAPHYIHFQGHSQAKINPGRQEQLNREKEIQGPCDLQLAVERPDNDLVIEYRQLPGHKQVPTIQANRGQHLERVASLDRNQTKGQRRVSFSDDRVALKSTETPASIVQDREAHKYPEAVHHLIKTEIQHISPREEDYPRTLVKDERDINQQLHTDGRCTTTDITHKSIPRDLSHEHLITTKEYPVISSTIAPSTKHLVSPAGEQVYIEETPLARLQQQYRSSSYIIINKNDFSANEAPSPVSEGVIQPSNLNRNPEISFGRLPSDLTASFIEMSILYIDHKETFLENTQRAYINEGRYTFGSVKLPLIEIDEAINGPDTTVTQLVPVEEESAQQESKLCRHSPPKVTDIHNNPDENVNGIRSSEWSNQTAIVPAADRIESQGCNDVGVSISDESTLQGPLICRANTHPNAQVVDEGLQSSEWSNTVASAPSPGHVDSEHNDDHRMPIYEETSLQIRTHNNTDGVDTSLSSSDSSPTHVNSLRDGDGKMPICEETSLQIKTCSNTDDVDTSLPSSEWASQTSTAQSAGHMNSQPCGYGGMPVYKESSPRYSKTRDEGNKTSQSSDWSDKSVNDPSAGLMMSPYYGAVGMSTNDGSEQQRIVFDSSSDKTRGNTQDVIIPVNTRVLHSRRPYQWHRMPVEIRQGDGSLPCHVCQSLLPLLDRINCQLRELESQEPLPNEDGGLQRDMDRVFESLYAAIDQREEELLASFGDHSPHTGRGDTDLASLLAHLENTKSYCDKTLVYTTKPELLSLTGMIHTRAEELLSQDIADPVPPSDVMFRDDGLPDLVQEIENFGKVFNEKDVDAAVKDKTFPKEHKLSESDIILEQRRSSLQSMPPMRRASMPPEDGRDFNSMPQNTMLDPNTQSVPPRRGSRDVDFNGYTGGKDVEGLPPHDPYSRDGLNGPERRGQGGYPYQQNNPVQSPDDRRYDHRGNQYDPQTRVSGPICQNPVDRRYEPSGNPYDPETRNADPMYQNPDDGRYDARGNPHGPQTRDTANGSPGNYPQGQMPHSRYPNDGNQPNDGPLDCDVITPDQAPQQRSAPDSYDEAPRLDPTEDRPAPNEAGMFPGSSALAVYVHAHHQKLRENDDDPVTKDTMIYSITPEPDSDRDAVLSVSPKLFQPEHTIKCVYMEFDKGTVYEENHVTHDGKLVNDPPNLPSPSASWRFKNYKGALSTRPLDGTGMSYLEFWTDIEIKQIHGGRSLIFEAAVADRDVIDLHHKAEDQSHAWGVSLSNCPEHDGLCRRTWGAGQSLKHYPHTLPNQPDSKARLRFGFFIMQKQKKLVVIDCNEEKVLLTADNIKISRPLWPVFGVYNTDLSHVETALVSGTNLKMDRNIAWLILQNI